MTPKFPYLINERKQDEQGDRARRSDEKEILRQHESMEMFERHEAESGNIRTKYRVRRSLLAL